MGARGPKARPVEDRFFEKVAAAPNGCIRWTAGTNGVGYGMIRLGPDDCNRKIYAHRWMYEHHIGPVPEGLHLDHLCRNTLCVNPYHLEPVTAGVNILRGVSMPAHNARKTQCVRGHDLGGVNLYVDPTTGYRRCRACARMRDATRRRRVI